jgi:hypothetical protein
MLARRVPSILPPMSLDEASIFLHGDSSGGTNRAFFKNRGMPEKPCAYSAAGHI